MTQWERMLAGSLYDAAAPELASARKAARRLTRQFNATTEDQVARRLEILGRLLGKMGTDCFIEPPFRCDYGKNIRLGDRFYANFGLIVLDICPVRFGNRVMLGPNVGVFAASHPIDAAVRASGLELGGPITVGDDVWIGGNAVLNPGVSVGEGSIIGSGSVVTGDIPPGVIAAGNPCRILRNITGEDRAHWEALAREYRASVIE